MAGGCGRDGWRDGGGLTDWLMVPYARLRKQASRGRVGDLAVFIFFSGAKRSVYLGGLRDTILIHDREFMDICGSRTRCKALFG